MSWELASPEDAAHQAHQLNALVNMADPQAELPPKRKILVFINPFSGTKKSQEVWDKGQNIVKSCWVEPTVIVTERQNHCREYLHTKLEPGLFEGIVCIGGDGIYTEAVNGLLLRSDYEENFKSMRFGLLPGGTSNGFVASYLHERDEAMCPESAFYVTFRGFKRRMDVMEVQLELAQDKLFCVLMMSAGIVADIDINSEVIRWAGNARIWMYAFLKIV